MWRKRCKKLCSQGANRELRGVALIEYEKKPLSDTQKYGLFQEKAMIFDLLKNLRRFRDGGQRVHQLSAAKEQQLRMLR